MYEVGTIKLTWISPQDYSLLESKMFPKGAIAEMLNYVNRYDLKKYMAFELVKTSNDEYEWRLLPYGQADMFLFHMKAQDSIIAWGIFAVVIGFSIYGMAKAYKHLK